MSSKTAARVNASIRELNYSSVVGQYNSAEFEGGAGLIMVNIPWLDNPFYSEIVRVPDNSYGLAHSAVCHILESANAPNGVFACSDTYGAAVISAARRAGLTVPGDLMVVGFDTTDNAIMTTPTLTTVNQPRYRMGYTACNILLERMKGAAAPQSMTMETELVVRESTTRSRA